MTTHTIVAVYDTPAHAELAIADLTAAGIPASSIQHYARDTADAGHEGPHAYGETESKGGFWAWLTGEASETGHHALYDHSMRSGSTVVTVIAEDHDSDKISAILEDHAPVDLEERASQYAGTAGMPAALPQTPAPAAGFAEEVLTLSEEALQVGKRAVDAGLTRIRRYTVERPVSEQVQLRDETVSVFRRPATGTTVGDAFTDKTIEMKQTREEAVVGKTAHVVEEVVLQKGSQERVETIRDTVRKEEVEVVGPHGDSTLPVR